MVRGFLVVSLPDAEPAWQGQREGGTEASQGIERDVEGKGTKSKGVNQVNIQTVVQDR
jgi:hypothetical protein